MTNDSVINDTSLKTIVDSENFVAIILDDLKWTNQNPWLFFYREYNKILYLNEKN